MKTQQAIYMPENTTHIIQTLTKNMGIGWGESVKNSDSFKPAICGELLLWELKMALNTETCRLISAIFCAQIKCKVFRHTLSLINTR
jgi:hypothetical protein